MYENIPSWLWGKTLFTVFIEKNIRFNKNLLIAFIVW